MNIKYYQASDFPKYLPKLNSLYDDLFTGGKGFRSKLVGMSAEPLNLDKKTVLLLCQTIEFIHNASLLHDDLIDKSSLRRNKTAAWLKYTPEYAVLAGDYLLARVMVNLSSYGNLKLIQLTAQTISDLLEGEWIQDSLVHDWSVNLSQLDQVHTLKTASLFKWCLIAPFVANESINDEVIEILNELGLILGMLFQRSDDLLDFNIRNAEGKTILGDIKSGYMNSFSAFLLADQPRTIVEEYKKIQSIEDIFSVVGEKYFNLRLKEFDAVNEKLILKFDHYLKELSVHQDNGLIENLRPLPELLYWRKQK